MAENVMFYASRAYVPLKLFSLYRKGLFEQNFSFQEFKYLVRIVIVMQLLDLTGHALMRYMSRSVVDKYVALNENEFAYKKKQKLDDYLIQKNYFKEKKEAQVFKNF